MKKFYYISTFIVYLLFCNVNFTKGQAGCDLNLIRQTFTSAGCTELAGCLSSCSMYFYNPISQTGDDAQAWAQNYGANLISVQSGAENDCMVNELNANSFGGIIWIGYNDIASENAYVWYDQSPVGYTNWNSGEPNNSGNEDCVQIYPNGKWNDLPCNSSGSKSVIEVNLCPVTTITSSATSVCAGQSVNLAASTILGSSPYTYSWTSNSGGFVSSSAGPTVTPNVTTIYSVTSTDRYGCTSSTSIEITVNSPTATITGTIAVCKDATAPVITLTGAAGAVPYTFTYTINGGANQMVSTTGGSNAVTVSVPTGTAGTFVYSLVSIQESSSANCSQAQSGSATVTINTLPTAIISGTVAECENGSAHDITFTGAGATIPYTFTYTLNGGSNQTVTTTSGSSVTVSAPVTVAGTFIYALVSVQEGSASACSQLQTGTATVTVNPLPTAIISGTTGVCKDAATPDITLTGADGTAPYTFTYTVNGGANQIITTSGGNSITIGVPTSTTGVSTYALISVQDASSTTCSQTQSGSSTVTVNPLPTATIAGTTTVCGNATAPNITFTGAGATAPYTFTYTINGTAQPTITTISGNSISIPAPTTSAGSFIYSLVSVKESSSTTCSQSQSGSATITVNPVPTATVTGSIAVCMNDASPSITFTGANATPPYTFTYTLNSGANQTISTTSGNSVSIIVPTNTASVYTYSLISVLESSSTACSQTQNGGVTVTVNPLPTATITGTTSVCKDATAPGITFTGASATAPYTFTYTINGVTQPTVVSTGNIATVSVPTSVVGTFVYALISVRDASSTICSQAQSGSATVIVNFLPTATIAGTTPVCNNAVSPNITFTGASSTAPYTFTYTINSGPNQTVTTTGGSSVNVPVPTGTVGSFLYELVSVLDGSVCSQIQSGNATIIVNPLPTATITGTTVVCKNATAPDITFTGASATAPYTFTYTINGLIQPAVVSTGNSATVSVPTIVAGAFAYALVSVMDASSTSCSQSQSGTATVIVNPLPTATITGTTAVCKNAVSPNITFTGAESTAPYTFTYTINGGVNQTITTTTGNSVILPVSTATAGTYLYALISVQDASSTTCSQLQSGSAEVTINPNPEVNFIANDTAGCEMFCLSFINSTSISTGTNVGWAWNVGDGSPISSSQNFEHCYSNDNVYAPLFFDVTLTVTSDSGCVSSLSKSSYITVYPDPTAVFSLQPEAVTIIDPVISFMDASIGTDFWNWDFGDGSTSFSIGLDSTFVTTPLLHTYPDTGAYMIMLITSTQYGCTDTAYQKVFIAPDFALYIASAFSPNDDGINDTFFPKGIFVSDYAMTIFDRWGNSIFFTEDFNNPWDGRINHGTDIAQADVYIYVIKGSDTKRKKHEYKGIVTLIR